MLISPPNNFNGTHIKENNFVILGVTLSSSLLLVFLAFLWQGHIGLQLADEGYLWYGVQRVLLGEVPIRDFASYEPGRYYWCAAISFLLGNNDIMTLRFAVAIFQWIGLFVALMLLTKCLSRVSPIFLLLTALTFMMWMFPRHKLFDITLSILLLAALYFLCERPSFKRYFLCGFCVGLAAFFGRNHGVYGFTGSMLLMLWLHYATKQPELIKSILVWGVGVFCGLSPIFVMAVFIPGFAEAFWEHQIKFLFIWQSTNLPLPIPWPWVTDFQAGLGTVFRNVGIGMFFIALPLFGVGGLLFIFWKRHLALVWPPVLIASICIALPYAHYAYSRADVGHLALGIFPFLLGFSALAARILSRKRLLMAAGMCVLSAWIVFPYQPGGQYLLGQHTTPLEVKDDYLVVDQFTAKLVNVLRQLDAAYAPGNRQFLVAPYWPGAYALLEKKAPMWDIYPIVSRPKSYQQAEVDRMRKADLGFVLLSDLSLDGRDELRFRNTFPDVFSHIEETLQLQSKYPPRQLTLYIKPWAETSLPIPSLEKIFR